MIQKFVLMPRTFYAFLYNFFFLCLLFVVYASASSTSPHIVLLLCSDSSKNAVCLSALPTDTLLFLFPGVNRNLCNIINPFAFLISNSVWRGTQGHWSGMCVLGSGAGAGLLQSRCHPVPLLLSHSHRTAVQQKSK